MREDSEDIYLLPSSAEVENAWRYNSIPHYVFMAWCSVKFRI